MSERFSTEAVVIGAGAVGLAIARALAREGREVMILEKTARIGEETSARNSEVIHAGIYYPKDSLKARLCVEGRKLLYAFCESHIVAHKRLGKLIVATTANQTAQLESLLRQANENGVTDLQSLSSAQVKSLEPELSAQEGLFRHPPAYSTAINTCWRCWATRKRLFTPSPSRRCIFTKSAQWIRSSTLSALLPDVKRLASIVGSHRR